MRKTRPPEASSAGGEGLEPSQRFHRSPRGPGGSQTGPSCVVYVPGAWTPWVTVPGGQTEGQGECHSGARREGLRLSEPDGLSSVLESGR